MKRSMLALSLCGLVTLGACSSLTQRSGTAPGNAAPVLKRILDRGELVVGTTGNQPPLNATTTTGETIGLEADLAEAMARAMGVDLKLMTMPFRSLLPALESGKVDMVLSGMTMTPKRNTRVAFVGPYFVSGKALLTKSKKMAAIKESRQINNADISLAALDGSTSQAFVEGAVPKARLVKIRDYDDGVEMVINGTVDALVADFTFCVASTLKYPDEKLSTLVAPLTFEPLGVALPAEDPLLVNWMENFLLMLEGTGAMDELRAEWFKEGEWLTRLK
jgi:polar amino acid transport system substrate-binding protein